MQTEVATAGRKRAAVELLAREEGALRRTARRYSLCEDDAEDAYQRALEILLVKAPNDRPRELIRWMKTVVKHEALAVRHQRERMLSAASDEVGDPVERLVSAGAGPGERLEQRDETARTREALQALKPAELRSLTLLAAGYSYAEIAEITGFSRTKVNRCLAEGRERFRHLLDQGESGARCEQLLPLLSAFADGEAGEAAEATVREHLRACASCRATMRSYRRAPATIAALAPALPPSRSLFERTHELLAGLHSRLPGTGGAGDAGLTGIAAGGTRGVGMAALAKALAICAGTVGGAVACVATGVAPAPLGIGPPQSTGATIEHVSQRAIDRVEQPAVEYAPAPPPPEVSPTRPGPKPQAGGEEPDIQAASAAGAVGYSPPPQPAAPPPIQKQTGSSSGSAAGEFGP